MTTKMKAVPMTELKRDASRIFDLKERFAVTRNGRIEGYYVPAADVEFETITDESFNELLPELLKRYGSMLTELSRR